MKRNLIGKILSTILILSLVLSAVLPTGILAGATTIEVVSKPDYSTPLDDLTQLTTDGWEASYSKDPQNGVAFEKLANISDTFEDWGTSISIGSNKGINWSRNDSNPFSKMSALTYTAKKYKYFTMTVQYNMYESNRPWPVISFNQPNEIPEMFYVKTAVSDPKSGDSAIGAYIQWEGHLNFSGKLAAAGKANSASPFSTKGWRTVEITVTPGKVYSAIYDTDGSKAVEVSGDLADGYEGGYISLMINGQVAYRNFSVTELDFYGDYSTTLDDLTQLTTDGWEASYSKDPQNGVAFEKLANLSDTFEDWGTSISIGSNKGINWSRNDSNPFSKMSALTYTAKKYKYFTMTVQYNMYESNRPWPVISFNQPNEIPEMFYVKTAVSDPTSGDSAIGTYIQWEGHLNFSGKLAAAGKANKTSPFSTKGWRTVEITVTPGKVYSAIYDTDGSKAVEVSGDLADGYEGGYISLMINGQVAYRNFSVTELPEVSINNYYATPDGNGGVADDKILIQREYGVKAAYSDILPERAGYSFMGFYSDADYANKIALTESLDVKNTVYAKWSDFADITADGNVNLKDLIRIKKMAVNEISATVAADLDFDGTNANGSDITVLRNKLLGENYESSVASAAELMNQGILYPLGRTMVLENAVEMDYVNTGFVLKGNFEGDVKADFTANRVGSLLNVSIDGGDNKVIDMNLDGLTTLAEDLSKGEHTIEVISGTSMRYSPDPNTAAGHAADNGTLRLNKLFYNGTPLNYVSDKTSRILFLGDSITCGMGLDTSVESGYKASNAYYTYASVLGRMLNAEVETVARCGSQTCHFAWPNCGRNKGPIDNINWLTSINLINTTEYDYANNQPDLVVINLGSNDIPYSTTEGIKDYTGDKYKEDVTKLLERVNKLYPNAEIIWTVGMVDRNTDLSKEYIGYFKSYVEEWSAANNNLAYFLDLSALSDLEGYYGHPTIETHNEAAIAIRDFMSENNILISESNLSELDSAQKKN